VDRRFFFRKKERMSGIKPVQRLFTEKTGSIFIYPLKLVWLEHQDAGVTPVRVLFAVPKRRFRKAHERNRVKRILREVYRKNAHLIREHLTSKEVKMDVSLAYVGEKAIDEQEVERIFLSIAKRFVGQVN
jgi:ribonuclease P protein component